MERQPYHLENLFFGNRKLFNEVLQNPETVFVFDNDGIISNTSKIVYKNFSDKNGILVKPSEISSWTHLTDIARNAGLDENAINHAEDDFYNSKVLEKAQSLLYIKPVIKRTVAYYGPERNFILTSRNAEFKDVTVSWFERKFPEFMPENILVRERTDDVTGEDFKIRKLREIAASAPWVVFIDDGLKFVEATLNAGIENCLVVNVPQGKTMPDFTNEHLIVIKRFPDELQAMYPLMDAIDRAIGRNR